MKGDGNDGFQARPDVLLPAEAADDEISQAPGQHLEPPIFVKKDDIFDNALISGRGTMPGERRSPLQAGGTKVVLSPTVKKTSATKAERSRLRPQCRQTAPTDDLLPRFDKKGQADLTGGREKKEGTQLPPSGEPRPERRQADSSCFCWQSMQYGVQGRAANRFLPISLAHI